MRTLGLVAIVTLVASAAVAQTPSAQPSQQNNTAAKQSPQAVQQQVRKNLQDAGFTDIQLMPSSFLVRAKDKSGNPVMMVINPDSITAVTEIEPHGSSTTGQGSNGNHPSQSGSAGSNSK